MKKLTELQLIRWLDEMYEVTEDYPLEVRWLVSEEHNRIAEFLRHAFSEIEEEDGR
jgi:hypothetical protein